MSYFSIVVKHKITDDSKNPPTIKTRKDQFLVVDETVEAALVTAYKHLSENYKEAHIKKIEEKESVFGHLIKDGSKLVFNTRVHFTLVDDRGGSEKTQVEYYYVEAGSMGEVESIMQKHLAGSIHEFRVWSATPSKIIEIIVAERPE